MTTSDTDREAREEEVHRGAEAKESADLESERIHTGPSPSGCGVSCGEMVAIGLVLLVSTLFVVLLDL